MLWSLSLGRFYGIDSLIEILIILVSSIISFYSHKIYTIVKDKNYNLFSFAFLFIAISFVFKIFSNFTIFHRIQIHTMNFVYTIFHQSQLMEQINFFSFIFYKVFYLLGFLVLFLILSKEHSDFDFNKNKGNKSKIFLFVYLGILAILFSIYFNFIFDLTLGIILFFLTLHFLETYRANKSKNTLIVFSAFIIILVGHFFFIFNEIHSLFYLIGEALLLIGFLSLLINQLQMISKGKGTGKTQYEKNTPRGNKRYPRNSAKK